MIKNYKWMVVVAILLSAGKASAAESIKNVETNEVKNIVYLDGPSPFSMYENDQKLREQSVTEHKKETQNKETQNKEEIEKKSEIKEIKEKPTEVAVELSEPKETESWVEEKTVIAHEKKEEHSIQPMTIYMGGINIPYQNGGTAYGQSIIDNNSNMAATWGGQPVQSGDDGLSTHIIGHNPGIFSVLFSLAVGSSVQITDGSASSSYYSVTKIWQVDDYGVDLATGEDTWELITGANNGESVVFQTCIDNDTNLIVMAQ